MKEAVFVLAFEFTLNIFAMKYRTDDTYEKSFYAFISVQQWTSLKLLSMFPDTGEKIDVSIHANSWSSTEEGEINCWIAIIY